MNIKSLVVSFALVAAASTTALARPASFTVEADASFAFDARTDGPRVRDHRTTYREDGWRSHRRAPRPVVMHNTKLYTNAQGQSWSEYTGPIYARGYYGFSPITDATRIGQVRQDFWLKGTQANTIQLRAVAGSTYVTSVLVEFGPGTTPQVVHVNRDLRDGAITIDLAGHTRPVYRIGVGGTSGRNASYQIFAR